MMRMDSKSERSQNTGLVALFLTLTLLGITGAVLFFPLNLGEQDNCLFDKIVSWDKNALTSFTQSAGGTIQSEVLNKLASEKLIRLQRTVLLQRYIGSYLVWWWGSLFLLIIGITRLQKRMNRPKSQLTLL